MAGRFVLSLDLEGMWGSIGSKDINGFKRRTRDYENLVNHLIDMIELYDIHCTWGIVGAYACNNPEEVLRRMDYDIDYSQWDIRIQDYIKTTNEGAYFFPEIVKRISRISTQEIGTHTFTHAYFLDRSMNETIVKNEVEKSIEVLSSFGREINTIIFPRNQVNPVYKTVLEECGVTICRSNPQRLFRGIRVLERLRKLLEFGNCYLPLTRVSCFKITDIKKDDKMISIPYSYFVRFSNKKLKIFEFLIIRRLKTDMLRAAKKDLILHIWFHPHNMGENMNENFRMLDEIFHYYSDMKERYGMESLNMIELAQLRQSA